MGLHKKYGQNVREPLKKQKLGFLQKEQTWSGLYLLHSDTEFWIFLKKWKPLWNVSIPGNLCARSISNHKTNITIMENKFFCNFKLSTSRWFAHEKVNLLKTWGLGLHKVNPVWLTSDIAAWCNYFESMPASVLDISSGSIFELIKMIKRMMKIVKLNWQMHENLMWKCEKSVLRKITKFTGKTCARI